MKRGDSHLRPASLGTCSLAWPRLDSARGGKSQSGAALGGRPARGRALRPPRRRGLRGQGRKGASAQPPPAASSSGGRPLPSAEDRGRRASSLTRGQGDKGTARLFFAPLPALSPRLSRYPSALPTVATCCCGPWCRPFPHRRRGVPSESPGGGRGSSAPFRALLPL